MFEKRLENCETLEDVPENCMYLYTPGFVGSTFPKELDHSDESKSVMINFSTGVFEIAFDKCLSKTSKGVLFFNKALSSNVPNEDFLKLQEHFDNLLECSDNASFNTMTDAMVSILKYTNVYSISDLYSVISKYNDYLTDDDHLRISHRPKNHIMDMHITEPLSFVFYKYLSIIMQKCYSNFKKI